jgi:hypothetical protein
MGLYDNDGELAQSALGPRPPDDVHNSLPVSCRRDRASNQFGGNRRGIPIAEPWA